MTSLTMLDDTKSKVYDKFIKYIKSKGYTTPIHETITPETEKDLKDIGITTDALLAEILTAMQQRKIIEKRTGDTAPKLTITEAELDKLAAEPENLQNFVVSNNKLVDITKLKEEYKAEYKAYKEAFIAKQIAMLTKFEYQNLSGLPNIPKNDFLDPDEQAELQKEVNEHLDESSYGGNSAIQAIIENKSGDFDWKEMVEKVIDFKSFMKEKEATIRKAEQDLKDGKLTTKKFIKYIEIHNVAKINEKIQEHLEGIEAYTGRASKYGIKISREKEKFSISAASIPEMKYEQTLLSKELQAIVLKTETAKKYGEADLPEPLSQSEFIKIITRDKLMVDPSSDEYSRLDEIQKIASKDNSSLAEDQLTSMVLSMKDDEELKYYRVKVANTDLDRFKALVSTSTLINETDDMVPTPMMFDSDKMSVPEYEAYLIKFYTAYGLDKEYVTEKNPSVTKRPPYPHEKTGEGHNYYENIYSKYLSTVKLTPKVANNTYILGLLNDAKDKPEMAELKTKIEELISLLTISDIPKLRADGKLSDCIGFVCETDKLPAIKAALKEIDPLGKFLPVEAIPIPRAKGDTESIEDYENYLKAHYTKYNPDVDPATYAPTGEIRKPYPHERISIDSSGKVSITEPDPEGYYCKFYKPWAKAKGLKETKKLSGSDIFTGRRKVTKAEKGLSLEGVKNAIKKFMRRLNLFDHTFTEDKRKTTLELFKRVALTLLAIAAVVIVLQFVAPGLLPWNFFPWVIKAVGKLGLGGGLKAVFGKLIQLAPLTIMGIAGIVIGIRKFKKAHKGTIYSGDGKPRSGEGGHDEPDPEGPTATDVEGMLKDGVDIEALIDKLVAEYVSAKREYDAAEALASDPDHATDETKAARDEKKEIKDHAKEDLVDVILEMLEYSEPAEYKEEIEGLSL